MHLDPRLAVSRYLIAADDFARQHLWECHSEEAYAGRSCLYSSHGETNNRRVRWEPDSMGRSETVGRLDGRPVVIQYSFAKLNGVQVCFYDCCSEVADWKMVNDWLDRLPGERANAENFHVVLGGVR